MSSMNNETLPISVTCNYRYNRLKDLTKYQCEPKCLCRFDTQRSSFDEMSLQRHVSKKNFNAPMPSEKFKREWGY